MQNGFQTKIHRNQEIQFFELSANRVSYITHARFSLWQANSLKTEICSVSQRNVKTLSVTSLSFSLNCNTGVNLFQIRESVIYL